jgi:hypothetical protein
MVYLVEIADEGILEFVWGMTNNGIIKPDLVKGNTVTRRWACSCSLQNQGEHHVGENLCDGVSIFEKAIVTHGHTIMYH